jgi:hypothetical protein
VLRTCGPLLFYEFIRIGVTRIGAFVEQTIAVIIPPGVDLNQEERVFLSGFFFLTQDCVAGNKRKKFLPFRAANRGCSRMFFGVIFRNSYRKYKMVVGGGEGTDFAYIAGKGKIILARSTAMSPLISHQLLDIGLGEEFPRQDTGGSISGKVFQDGCPGQRTGYQPYGENGSPDNEDRQRPSGFRL